MQARVGVGHGQLPCCGGSGSGSSGIAGRRTIVVPHAVGSSSQQQQQQVKAPPAAGTGGASDWSARLLAVAKNNKASNTLPPADVFTPRRGAGSDSDADGEPAFDGDQDAGGSDDAGPSQKKLPAEMRCFDTARIFLKGGDGGNGCVAFRREKYVEHGGPAGGCGGRGGNVWAVVDPDLNSLTSFRGSVHFRATPGVPGQGSNCDGADAPDLHIPVPPGTIVRRKGADEGEAPLAELLQPGDKALLLVGGRGGRGNFSFKTSRDRTPTIAEKGEVGAEMWVDLELKVVADVGIIGVPNAGKSTLLSVITAARPKIANYPFTTLVPNLGVCELDYRTTVFADVPGLLEGAHEGLGLGHEFLRHVQRCRVLVHVIDGTSPDPVGDYRAINLELELFNPALRDKPQVRACACAQGAGKQESHWGRTALSCRTRTRACMRSSILSHAPPPSSPTWRHVTGTGLRARVLNMRARARVRARRLSRTTRWTCPTRATTGTWCASS